jgi:hypothetical protein
MRPKWLTPRQNCHPDRSVPGFPTSRCSNDCVCGFLQENRMMLINATGLDRKSGGAQWRDLRFSGPFVGMFFDRA